jgi:hypothetical protein
MLGKRYFFLTSVFVGILSVSAAVGQAAAGSMQQEPSSATAKAQDNSAPRPEKAASKESHDKPVPASAVSNPVLWRMPEDIAGKNLFYGQEGEQGQPRPPFVFLREDMHGTSPKFDARDANRRKWRGKLGPEARPEVVASRLLWAVGYYVNTDYVLPEAQVQGLRMRRKSASLHGTTVTDARFAHKPKGEKKLGIWSWKQNPFFGTREFNGLRVMMALMNSWDLKDSNNAVYADKSTHQQIYLVSDIGATFGTTGLSWTPAGSKGKPNSYASSKFVTRNTGVEVDFATPSPPKALLAESFGFGAFGYLRRERLDWIGKNIPNPDAHWIGTLLGQLSHQQLVDAFRAGNFPPDQIEEYVAALESRIHELEAI